MEAARRFEAQERERNQVYKSKSLRKRKGIQKKKLLDTPYEINIY